ncbi:hypothetical protein SDC9_170542 [bioreactor metagenome]|uniref:Uncharacterized protein n=1 Tax=bioreactor metagenome TaxID=1076179 RepID=A0A645G937_9ZZZZ
MAGGIEEGDRAIVDLNLIGADVLRNAARLAGGDVRVADGVKQRGLAVVDVTHDHNDGAAGREVLLDVLSFVKQALLNGDNHFAFNLCANFHGDERGGIIVDDLRDRCHNANAHQALDDFGSLHLQAQSQLANGHLVRQRNLQFLASLALKL